MRNNVLKDFAITYSLRPLGLGDLGTVYRRYPGMWQVWHAVSFVAFGAGFASFSQSN
jgi:hypothetical protein